MSFHAKRLSSAMFALRQEERASSNGEASTSSLKACREVVLEAMRHVDEDLNWVQARALLDGLEMHLRRRGLAFEPAVLSLNRLQGRH